MKYDMTARVYGMVFRRILGSYYKKHVPEMSASARRAVFQRIQKEYKSMLERTPGVGGKENSLEADLIGACWFFSLAKADPDMSPERMDDVIAVGFQSNFMQKSHRKERENGTLFSGEVQDKKLREAERSQHSEYEMDWKFTYEKGEDEFYCTYTECGICKLAEREHVEAWLPCLCRMDYGTYDMVGAELIRTKTLAAGDDCCDFHVIRKKGQVMIERLGEADFDKVFSLMERSFPEDERRDYSGQRELLTEPAYNLYAKRSAEDAGVQAFLALWELGDLAYIEHFAVDPDCRNGGLGGKILQKVIEKTELRICLEVEPPETEMAARRIRFYERNGFSYNDYFYMQPPIAEGRNAIPLRLMTTGGPLDEAEFSTVRDLLYEKVYGVSEDWRQVF